MDNDIRKSGEVYYETFEKGKSKTDDVVLDEVNRYIRLNTENYFTGTFMILAEWQNVHPHPHGSCDFYDIIKSHPTTRTFINQVYIHIIICLFRMIKN